MNFTFTLTEEQTNVVFGALGELPAKTSMNVIKELEKQAMEQVNAKKTVEGPVK